MGRKLNWTLITDAKPDPPRHFPDWPVALAVAELRPEERERYAAILRGHLSFCRRMP